MCPEWKTEDGFDMQLGTNHLGHFLFTELITPLLMKSASSGFDTRLIFNLKDIIVFCRIEIYDRIQHSGLIYTNVLKMNI